MSRAPILCALALALVAAPGCGRPVDVVDLATLPYIDIEGRKAFKAYQDERPPKAFAIAPDGTWASLSPWFALGFTNAWALGACDNRRTLEYACFLFAAAADVLWTNPLAGIAEATPELDLDARQFLRTRFLGVPFNRAFALSADGAFGSAWGPGLSLEAAGAAALADCRASAAYDAVNDCRLYIENDRVMYQAGGPGRAAARPGSRIGRGRNVSGLTALCVYCGSSGRVAEAYRAAAARLGTLLAEAGITLVYGGGQVGLMGLMADAALCAGGRVVGVIPRHLVEAEAGHHGLSELHVVETMHARKAKMFALADAFAVLPGGIGTLDETLEVMTWKQLGLHDKPILLVDVAGYWAPFRALLDTVVDAGFARPAAARLITVVGDIDAVVPTLAAAPPPHTPPATDLL